MKRYKLRGWVKTLILIVLLEVLLISYLFLCSERIERIENNENEVVSVRLWR